MEGYENNEEYQANPEIEEKAGPFEFHFEGLEDGYRVTVKGDRERVQRNRQVRRSFMDFLCEADRAGLWIPRPFRWMLKLWQRYNRKM